MIPHKQLSLADIFEDCQNIFEEDKPQFLALLEQHIDIDEIIPITFRNHFNIYILLYQAPTLMYSIKSC